MKRLLFQCMSCLSFLSLNVQLVISSIGANLSNSEINISFTLGEPVIETISDGKNVVTQGFQHFKHGLTYATIHTEVTC